MKIRNVSMNDDEMPATVTVEMTVDEAALLYALTGRVAPATVTGATDDVRWGNALYDIADCLAGAFFNRFWEGGAQEVAPTGLRVVATDPDQGTPTTTERSNQ